MKDKGVGVAIKVVLFNIAFSFMSHGTGASFTVWRRDYTSNTLTGAWNI